MEIRQKRRSDWVGNCASSTSSWIKQSESMHNDCCCGNRGNKSGGRSLAKTTYVQSSLMFSLPVFLSLELMCVLFQCEISLIQSPQKMCKYRSRKCLAMIKLTNHAYTKRQVLVASSFNRAKNKNNWIRSLKAINAILYYTGQCCDLLGRFGWCPFIDVHAHVTVEFKNTL